MKFEGDNRAYVIEDDGQFIQIGFRVFDYKFQGKFYPLMVNMPDLVALNLSICQKHYMLAKQFYDSMDEKIIYNLMGEVKCLEIRNSKEGYEFFNYIECCFTSIIFGYIAAEGFVNSLIKDQLSPDEIRLISEKFDIGTVSDLKVWIERKLTIENKIKVILPIIYKFNINLEEVDWWEDFKDLLNFRNEIVHPKAERLKPSLKENGKIIDIESSHIGIYKKIIVAMINRDIIGSVKRFMEYLADKTGYPPVVPIEIQKKAPTFEEKITFLNQNIEVKKIE